MKDSVRSAALALIFAGLISPVMGATSWLDNGTIRITVDLNQGGGIVALYPTGHPEDSVINTYDRGRNCQQSYYSGPSQFLPTGATQHPDWNPWKWNPVQGGDCFGNGSGTIDWSNDGTTLYVKSRPKQWALQNYDADCILEQWITLAGSVATVQNRLTNSRSDTTQYEAVTQELPAIYTWRALKQLWTYTGTQPFTSGGLTQIPKTAPPWAYFRATEGWAAYTMDNAGNWGVGVFLPGNCSWVGGFDGSYTSGNQTSPNTGYIAPIRKEVIDHNIVYDYTYQLILGNLADIRSYAVAHQPNLKPNFFFRGTRAGWTYTLASDSGYPVPSDRLHVNVNSNDPQMWGPECSFQAADVPEIYIRAAYHCAGGGTKSAQLFWERENGASTVSESQSQSFTATNDGNFRMYTLNLSANPNWNGQISRLRLDPVQDGGDDDYVEVLGITSTAPGVNIAQSGDSTTVTEDGATDTYTVVLTGEPTASVTITPSPDSQLTVSPPSLTFTLSNWSTPQTVTVTAVNDAVAEGAHSGTVTHAAVSADPGYNGITIATVTATITDNDTAGVVISQSGGSTAVTEGGATDTYTAALTSQPTANVVVTPSPDSQLTVSPASLTFTSSNWSTPQTVTVTAVNDALAEGTHSGTVTHAAVSADPGYNGITIATVTATITDDVSSFNEWAGTGVSLTPALLLNYAIGGATGPTGSNEQVTVRTTSSLFTLSAVIRINDPQLRVLGQVTTNLTRLWSDLTTNPYGVPSASQTNVPFGCERRDFSLPIETDPVKFIRLKAIQVVFNQNFSSSTNVSDYSAGDTGNNVTGDNRFNYILDQYGNGTVSAAGNNLQLSNMGVGDFVFGKTFSATPLAGIKMEFDFSTVHAGLTPEFQHGIGFFQFGNPAGGSGWGGVAIDIGTVDNSFRIQTQSGHTGNFTGTQHITMYLNSTGSATNYIDPNGATQTLADRYNDVWVGNTLAGSVYYSWEDKGGALTGFRWVSPNTWLVNQTTTTFDNFDIQQIPKP